MTRCGMCSNLYPVNSHYGICTNTFGKCIDCMIEAKELNEGHLEQIYFLSGDINPEQTTII